MKAERDSDVSAAEALVIDFVSNRSNSITLPPLVNKNEHAQNQSESKKHTPKIVNFSFDKVPSQRT